MESAYYPQGYPSRPRPSGEKRGERAVTGSGEGVAFPGGIGKANPKAVLRGESIPPGDSPTDLQRSQAP